LSEPKVRTRPSSLLGRSRPLSFPLLFPSLGHSSSSFCHSLTLDLFLPIPLPLPRFHLPLPLPLPPSLSPEPETLDPFLCLSQQHDPAEEISNLYKADGDDDEDEDEGEDYQ
jgi:hypothetical protein